MEFNARYALNGIFALAVILAAFAFVYWLRNSDGLTDRTTIQIRYPVPVSGLSRGSDVLFNGLKVGRVDRILLDSDQPEQVVAIVSVVKWLPLREDTVAGVDYAGLTGAASVQLTGGTPDAPRIDLSGATVPILYADAGESRSWTQKANRILGVIDDLVSGNRGRFDAILAGLERLAGGGTPKEQPVTQDLLAATDLPADDRTRDWQLSVSEPTVVLSLNTDRVLRQVGDSGTQPIGEVRWADSIPALFQARTVQSFENAGYFNVLRSAEATDAQYGLAVDIRKFWIDGTTPEAVVEFTARLSDSLGAMVAVRQFSGRAPVEGEDDTAAAAALRAAYARGAGELVEWVAATLP